MIDDKIEAMYVKLIEEFSNGNEHLFCKLFDDRPLMYYIAGSKKPYVMVDYMYQMTSDPQQYDYFVNKSLQESCSMGMFQGYNIR